MQHPIMNLFQSPSNNSDNPEKHSNGDLFNCESQLFGNVSLLSAPEASDSLLSLFNERETFAFEDCMYTSNNNSSLLHSLSSTGYNSWSSSSLGFDFQTSYSLDALSSDSSVLSTPARFETPLTKDGAFPSPLSVNIIPLKNYRDNKSNMSSQMMAIQKDTFDQPSLESIAKNIETLLEDSFSVNDLNLMKELKKIENDVRSALIMKEHTRMMNSNNNNAGSSCSSSISASTPSIASSSSSMKKDEHASHILTRSQAQKKRKQSSSSRKNALPVLSSPQTKKRGKTSTKRKRASADEDSESEKSSNSSNDSDSDFRPSSTENNECTTEEDEETEDDSKSSTTTTCKRKATSSASKSRTATPQPRKKRTTFAKADIALLTKWLHDHSNNPYPTDDEKKTLLECVNMTKDQLETWFVNNRKRLLPNHRFVKKTPVVVENESFNQRLLKQLASKEK